MLTTAASAECTDALRSLLPPLDLLSDDAADALVELAAAAADDAGGFEENGV
jgi:hypothetical protein